MVEARPKLSGQNGLLVFALLILLLAVIGAIPFLLLINYFYLSNPYSKPPPGLQALTLIPGFLFGIYYSRNLRSRENWILTETELKGGPSHLKFPLASIERIIVGLPTASAIPAVDEVLDDDEPGTSKGTFLSVLSFLVPNLGTARRNFKIRAFQRERTLVLIFNDGSLLPLCLLLAINGEALMAELESRFRDRLIFNYNYSDVEAHKLSMIEANVLVPARKSPLKI